MRPPPLPPALGRFGCASRSRSGSSSTIPSPDSLPLRAASTIASTTRPARSSGATKTSSAFGRKRDSKTRPRYSCVIPRWRPWPTASITVTPTWPACVLDGVDHGLDPLADHDRLDLDPAQGPSFPLGRCPARRRRVVRSARASRRRGSRSACAARCWRRSPGRSTSGPSRSRPRRPGRGARSSSARPIPWPRAVLGDVDAVLDDAGVAGPARDRRERRPADDLAVPLGDEPVLGEVGGVPRLPAGRRRLERRLPRGDALLVDRLHGGPVALCASL